MQLLGRDLKFEWRSVVHILGGWLAGTGTGTATAAAAASVLVVILDFLFAHHHIAEVHEN